MIAARGSYPDASPMYTSPDIWIDAYTEASYSKPVPMGGGSDHSGCIKALKLISAAVVVATLLR